MSSARNVVLLSVLAAAVLVALLFWKPERSPSRSSKEPLIVYCAAGIKPPVEVVAREYEKSFGFPIQLQYGGSGTLLSNLRVAGKGDLFLAADESYLDQARTNNLLAEVVPLAQMLPVIAVAKGNPKGIKGISDLLREDVRVALANPDAAAIGKITRDLLQQTGEWPALEKRTKVFKPTVNDVANDIRLGAVDAGIIWDATASQYPELEMIQAPALAPARHRIAIGVLNFTRQPTAALRFARYLGARDKGLLEFKSHGYQPVEGDVWVDIPEVVLFSGGVNRMAIEPTIQRFETREGAKVTRVYNGCGILVSQIKSGQRPDAYFSCDVSFMRNVSDIFPDAVNLSETAMLMLVAKGNPLSIHGLADLAKPGLRVGLANARQSALGALSEQVLKDQGMYDRVMANVKVQTPTADLLVNQMRTGALDAVIVYEANTSQVRDVLEVVRLELPAAKAIQPYGIGKNSDHKLLMERLLAALRSADSRKQFESVGFHWYTNGN